MNGIYGKMALVLGYGSSGRAAAALLKQVGFAVSHLDGVDPFPAGGEFSLAVVSPGVPLTHPWLAECRCRGITVKSELQLGIEELVRRGVRIVAVTGSKGKSSVVKLLAEALKGIPCGNYGLPVSQVAALPEPPQWAVVEVSSFQMETTDLPKGTIDLAAVLNLQEDHLDRHGSVATYHALKLRLLDFARIDINPRRATEEDSRLFAGSYFDNEILSDNAAVAIALMRGAGLGDAEIRAAFLAFKPLPHRMNAIGTFGGVRYIDDSKATSIAALAAGVRMAGRSVRLVAGGLPKGDDPKTALPSLTGRVKKVYTIGRCAEEFANAWSSALDCEVCGTMERAVQVAMREAEDGDTVLLSPGAASFDQFNNFGERGDTFADFVNKQGKDK